MNLLIIDDEIEIINGIMAGVRWENLCFQTVYQATSIEESKKLFYQDTIDIVLCDIEMPDGSGLDLLEWIRMQYPKTVRIIMTCHEEFDYARRAIALDCKDYIVKPMVYEELEEKLLHIAKEINRNWENDKYQAFGREWMKQIIREGEVQEGPASREEIVKQVKSYITANLQEELRIEFLAKKFFLSADYLSRLFKKEEGIGIGDFILEERMFLARELLKEGRLSIARVAYECGYDNYSYFTKIFKKKYGMTPRESGQVLKEKESAD